VSDRHPIPPRLLIGSLAIASGMFLALATWSPGDAPWTVRLVLVVLGAESAVFVGALMVAKREGGVRRRKREECGWDV
jgi:hypothetical protein